MELVSVYLYNRIPIETDNISNQTFHALKRNGWYNDNRSNKKFTMLNKRFCDVDDQWFRVMIRFEYGGVIRGQESFALSVPCPFIVTKCERIEGFSDKWRDTKTYHVPKLGSVSNLIDAGVSADIIDAVLNDLHMHVRYNH